MKKIISTIIASLFLFSCLEAQFLVGGSFSYITSEPKQGSMFKGSYGGGLEINYMSPINVMIGLRTSYFAPFRFDEGWAKLMLANSKTSTITQDVKYSYLPIPALTLKYVSPSTGIYIGVDAGYHIFSKSGSVNVKNESVDTTMNFSGKKVSGLAISPQIGVLYPIVNNFLFNANARVDIEMVSEPNYIISMNVGVLYYFGGKNIQQGRIEFSDR